MEVLSFVKRKLNIFAILGHKRVAGLRGAAAIIQQLGSPRVRKGKTNDTYKGLQKQPSGEQKEMIIIVVE